MTITKPALDAEESFVVGTAEYAPDTTDIIATKSADITNSDSDLNQTASTENRSAKYKYPNVSQSPEATPAEEAGEPQE